MKKVNYKSLESVKDRFGELVKDNDFQYRPFEKDFFRKNIFKSEYNRIDAGKVLQEARGEKSMEKSKFSDYSYIYSKLKTRLFQAGLRDELEIERQIKSFVKLLSTNPDEAYFVANLLAEIYEEENFKSKQNKGQFATEKEKKKLLDIPLDILKANNGNKLLKRSVLYYMLQPVLCECILFDETIILNMLMEKGDRRVTAVTKTPSGLFDNVR